MPIPRLLGFLCLVLATACGGGPEGTPAAPQLSAQVTFTLGPPSGQPALRSLVHVNAGPLPSPQGVPQSADFTSAYREIGVGMVRTHDLHGPFDLDALFPDPDADPALPGSYDFSASDTHYRAITGGGFEPFPRLGTSWADAARPEDFPGTPEQRTACAQAAVQILRHYRSGQWNGFQGTFRHVEIWNEPDNTTHFWPLSREAFFDLYVKMHRAIKAAYPELRVGGPGLTQASFITPQGQAWARAFLDALRAAQVSPDFVSWHCYTNNPADLATGAAWWRAELNARGFQGTEQMVTEYHTEASGTGATAVAYRAEALGAAVLTGNWIALQGSEVAQAFVYRGNDHVTTQPWFYGLFSADTTPKKPGLAVQLWKEVQAHPVRLGLSATGAPAEGFWSLAAQKADGSVALLVAQAGATAFTWTPAFGDGRSLGAFRTRTLRTVSNAASSVQTASAASPPFTLPGPGVQLLLLVP